MSKRPSRREFSIPGDELEQHRIQLEHNLQNTDLSLHLSSASDDDADNNESLEYPRHNSPREHFPAFASFDRNSRDNMDLDASHIRVWSIHGDDGIAPYDVRTMSTAAHHASAVTITAGLGRGERKEPSISGAEYDPERPLQDIIAACHVGSDAGSPERSRDISRPRLSETLQRAGFSPRRPRGGQPRASLHPPHGVPEDPNPARRSVAPRTRKATVSFDMSGSRFTKMARGLVRDIRQAQEQVEEEDVLVAAAKHRSTVKNEPNRSNSGDLNHDKRAAKKSNRNRVHLPDITGLTNAVVSPAKATLERYGVRGQSSKEVEARLVAALNALHTRLNHLETENSTARRRVRELEFELEDCKRVNVVVQEKKALEALITTLRSHLARVTSDLSSQQQQLEELRSLRESDTLSLTEKTQEINQLRTEVERLAGEIEVLRGVVEEGLNERRQGRDEASIDQDEHPVDTPAATPHCPLSPVVGSLEHSPRRFIDDDEIDRISVDLGERRSERASNSTSSSADVSLPRESPRRRAQDPDMKPNKPHPPFPKINSERMERMFFSAPRHNTTVCRMCKDHHPHRNGAARDNCGTQEDHHEDKGEDSDEDIELRPRPDRPHKAGCGIERTNSIEEILDRMDRNGGTLRPGDVPPQTVLARVIAELEDEFAHFREIYGGLAAEYRTLDCAMQGAKRHVVGDRLRDVIGVLECKGNQIASLYDLLVFKDKAM